MRRKIGAILMALGAALVAAALGLFLWNRNEDARAGRTVEEILPQVVREVDDRVTATQTLPDPYDPAMTEVEIDGYLYVGVLSIPALELELPVMSSWSYPQLKIAPCRYAGATKTGDLVIAAHNYDRHFGNIQNLSPGDAVLFTDMDGTVTSCAVAEIETLASTALEEMTGSGYPLTLFTCTYSGQSRVTVRCDLAQ